MNLFSSQEFLSAFPGYYIQTLDDKASAQAVPKRQPIQTLIKQGIPSKFPLSVLTELNKKGAGIFFTPNQFTEARRKNFCKGVNAWVMEMDKISKEEQLKRIGASPLIPSIIVESLHSYHCYWLAENGSISNYKLIVEGIIQFFDSDPSCKDVTRLLRIPGFYNNKKEPFLVKVHLMDINLKYTEEQMLKAFPFRQEKRIEKPASKITLGMDFWDAVPLLDNKTVLMRLSGQPIVQEEVYSFRKRPGGGEYIDVNGQPADAWLDEYGMIGSGKKGGPTYIQWLEYFGVSKRDIASWIKQNCKDLLPSSLLFEQKTSPSSGIFTPMILKELLNKDFSEVEWLVKGLIPTESIIAISGSPASFKTWFILDLALKIAAGDILFDVFETQKCNVLLIDEESGERLLQKRLQKMQKQEDLPFYFHSLKNFQLNENLLKEVLAFCKKNAIKVIIIDALVRIHTSDENSAMEMARVFKMLKELVKEGITIIFTHHHRKPQKGKKGTSSLAHDMRGSSDILASVDCHIAIERHDNELLIQQTKLRQEQERKPFRLKIFDESECFLFKYEEELEQKNKNEEFQESILKYLEENRESIKKKDLYGALKKQGASGEWTTFKKAFEKLLEEGKIYISKGKGNTILCSIEPFQLSENI